MVNQKQQTKTGVPVPIRAFRRLVWIAIKINQRLDKYLPIIFRFLLPGIASIIDKMKLKKLLQKKFDLRDININSNYRVAVILRDGKAYPKSSAFIRLVSPLTNSLLKDRVSFEIFDEKTTVLPKYINICIVQRTALNDKIVAGRLIDFLKKNSIKLIIDLDDAFGLIDKSHSEHSSQGNTYEAVHFLAKNADQIWVSTNELRKMYLKENKNVYVIKNTLDERLWKKVGNKSKSEVINMLYMGTATHDADLKIIVKALDDLYAQYPYKFKLTVIGISRGDLPEREWIERLYQPRGFSIYPKFVEWLQAQGPFDIGFCPLVDTPFNKNKSDIKCLDYIACNALPIASDVEAYGTRELGKFIIKVENNNEQWVKTLGDILADTNAFLEKKEGLIKDGQKYLWAERSNKAAAMEMLENINALEI